jgi:hypothetical protein
VVIKSVPENAVVVGVPGQNIARSQPIEKRPTPDLNHNNLPDVIGITLTQLTHRMEKLESLVNGSDAEAPVFHISKDGTWEYDDYSI